MSLATFQSPSAPVVPFGVNTTPPEVSAGSTAPEPKLASPSLPTRTGDRLTRALSGINAGLLAVVALVAKNLVRGSIGRQWMAVRDMDIAAEIIGACGAARAPARGQATAGKPFDTAPLRSFDGNFKLSAADYDRILDVSLRGTLYMSQATLPAMKRQRAGSIICISSVSAQRGGGILGGPHYSAAKAGVLGLARAMAREYGGNNIRVNCVTPGLIATDINKGKIPDDKRQGILDGIPLARIGEPNDVAGCVLFLASDLSKYCTGITLDVNGGMLIH